jgi:hypothetical protein
VCSEVAKGVSAINLKNGHSDNLRCLNNGFHRTSH